MWAREGSLPNHSCFFFLCCFRNTSKITSSLCFAFKVTGNLDDCTCDVETIDGFNNDQLFPKLQTLLESDYFRFYKVRWTDGQHTQPHTHTNRQINWSVPGDVLGLDPLQVNLNKPCPFWKASSHCGLRDCAVKPCSPVSSSFRLNQLQLSSAQKSQWDDTGEIH